MRNYLNFLGWILIFAVPGMAPGGAGEFLRRGQLSAPVRAAIGGFAAEALRAVIDGRAPVAAAAMPPEVTRAMNGVEIAVVRDGAVVAQGYALNGDSLLHNIRLAAGRAVYNFRVRDFAQCTLGIALLGEGKSSSVPTPLFQWQRGRQACRLEHQGKHFFVGVLAPLLAQHDWQQALAAVLQTRMPQADSRARLDFLADKATKLTVFSADSLILPPGGKAPLLLDADPEKITVAVLQNALAAADGWWLTHQGALGGYADDGRIDAPESAFSPGNNAWAALCLGQRAQRTRNAKLRIAGLKIIDWLLMHAFLEAPGGDCGYIVNADKSVDTGINAVVLRAMHLLNAMQNNAEMAKYARLLTKFIEKQRQPDGYFRPWFRPAEKITNAHLYQALAISALLSEKNPEHGAAMQNSLQALLREFAPFNPQRKLPKAEMFPWLTLAASAVYQTTQTRKFITDLQRLQTAGAQAYLPAHVRPRPTFLAKSLLALSFGETARWERLLNLRPAENAARRDKLLAEILPLQISPDGAWAALLPTKNRPAGAFLPEFGDLSFSLPEMVAATLALDRAVGD